ncbi:MAG: hypothetical protein V7L00_07200 [Nostoc sp.]|uniref:hypothetical protein n=1 Tax=Nostoc sp. TaxID=1180 RepID=UPI002FF777F6
MEQPNLNKGYRMEESLRDYFLQGGYYVIRGVPFIYEKFAVTDIDLWLYARTSSVSRDITIVDIKNKKTPQAIERIFWVQGLKQAVKATNAIVATTDKRAEVKNFGRDLGILILDGLFLDKLSNRFNKLPSIRWSEEEFFLRINEYSLQKVDGDWKGRIVHCKSLLSKGLSFDNCNEWLNQAKFFTEQIITNPKQRETSLRCLYLICSFIAIAIDFLLKDFSFLEHPERVNLMTEGFIYGSKGNIGMEKVINVSMGLVEQYANGGRTISNQVRASIRRHLSEIPANILGEYFSKVDVGKKLFEIAVEFEHFSMKKSFSPHTIASIELRSMLACLLDFWGIDRVQFSKATEEVVDF